MTWTTWSCRGQLIPQYLLRYYHHRPPSHRTLSISSNIYSYIPRSRFLSYSSSPNSISDKMPRLNAVSKEAIHRLSTYSPPPSNYGSVPFSRRAAVLILLYADSQGDLRAVLTVRSKALSSFAGQVALPGGKADSLEESSFETARREAREEIGLPDDDITPTTTTATDSSSSTSSSSNTGNGKRRSLPHPFKVEHLCELPAHFAKSALVVRPCVAFLHSYDETTGENAEPETSLIPRLDPKEVAAVFTVPFRNLLSSRDENDPEGDSNEWYQGAWGDWYGFAWRMHQFFVPISDTEVIKPRPKTASQKVAVDRLLGEDSSSSSSNNDINNSIIKKKNRPEKSNNKAVTRYRLYGMTARILIDAARIAYAREPDFEHNRDAGDEDMITELRARGQLGPVERRRKREELGFESGYVPSSKV